MATPLCKMTDMWLSKWSEPRRRERRDDNGFAGEIKNAKCDHAAMAPPYKVTSRYRLFPDAPLVYTGHAARLVREHRIDGVPWSLSSYRMIGRPSSRS